jgi:hypothetical protein
MWLPGRLRLRNETKRVKKAEREAILVLPLVRLCFDQHVQRQEYFELNPENAPTLSDITSRQLQTDLLPVSTRLRTGCIWAFPQAALVRQQR